MSKKNILRYVLLGLLCKEALTGYDIRKHFEQEIGDIWSSSHSQVYPELKKMEQEELIQSKTVTESEKMVKTYYKGTEKGQALLNQWLYEPIEAIQPTRNDFTMKLFFISDPEDVRVDILLREEISLHQEKLRYLNERMKKVFGEEAQKKQDYGHYLILEQGIMRETVYLEWLHRKQAERIKQS